MASDVGVDSHDIRSVERTLLRLDEGLLPSELECNIMFEVQTLSSWIIKFRHNGTILNNCELVIPNINIAATISFKSHTAFWAVSNGGEQFDDAISKGAVVVSGNEASIDIFRRKISGSEPVRDAPSSATPTRLARTASIGTSGEVPLKSGWLLKKRDLFSGWRCRYFIVYMGRVDYFIDQHDLQPRGSVPLFGAEVSAARKMTINGVSEHWGMTVELNRVEPKQKEKSFKLASELTGDEGMVEATTWVQVFTIASKKGSFPINVPSSISSSTRQSSSSASVSASRSKSPHSRTDSVAPSATSSSASGSGKVSGGVLSDVSSASKVLEKATKSTITLSLPFIVLTLVILFFAGWLAGGATSGVAGSSGDVGLRDGIVGLINGLTIVLKQHRWVVVCVVTLLCVLVALMQMGVLTLTTAPDPDCAEGVAGDEDHSLSSDVKRRASFNRRPETASTRKEPKIILPRDLAEAARPTFEGPSDGEGSD